MAQENRSFPLVLLGLFLLAAGLLLGSVQGGNAYLSRLVTLSGVALFLWGLIRGWPTIRFFFTRMRRVAEPGPAMTWLLLGVLLLVLAVGFNLQRIRVDLTGRKLNSLSATSRSILSRLTRPVELVGVYRENAPEEGLAEDLLAMYRTDVARVHTSMLDPERKPEEARRLGIDFRGGVLVRADSAREVVAELSESALTQAILRVSDPLRPVVGVAVGHGETGDAHAGLTTLHRAVVAAGFELRTLDLGSLGDVPDEVRALLIIGPKTRFLPGEAQIISRFLDRGGRLGCFLDPATPNGLEEMLAAQGIVIDSRRVWDDGSLSRSVGLGPETVAVASLGEHPITRGLASAIVLRGAARVGLKPDPIWGRTAKEILRSAPSAMFREGQTGEPKEGGPVATKESERPAVMPLGVALEWGVPPRAVPAARDGSLKGSVSVPEKPSARIVVIGDSDFLRDDGIDLYGNREFAMRVLGWLEERDFLLKFPFADERGTPLRVGLTGLRALFFVFELILPLAMFGLAMLVWTRRR